MNYNKFALRATQGNLTSDIDQAVSRGKLDGVTLIPDTSNLVTQSIPGSRKRYLIPAQQTKAVASSERQWDINPTVKGPFALKTSVSDSTDYIEWNAAGAGLNGIYNVVQLFIYGTITELSGLNAPHRFGPCTLWFKELQFRSDTDDVIFRMYDFSGLYGRFNLLNNVESRALFLSYVDQFGMTVTFTGFGAAGVPNQLGANETKSWCIPLYGTPIHFIPPAILGVQSGYSGNFTMRLFMKPVNLMKETVVNATDSYNINCVMRIITDQRGSVGLQQFENTINWLEMDYTYITCLVMHEIFTNGVQAGGGFLPAFGAGATFDFVPGIAAQAWINAFFFVVRDRPAVQNASNEYTLIPFFNATATSSGANNVTMRVIRDGTQDVINVGSFMIQAIANAPKYPGADFLAAQPIWMMAMGECPAKALNGGVVDGFLALQTNDTIRFQGGTTLVKTFAATNKIDFFMYAIMQVVADVHRNGTIIKSWF